MLQALCASGLKILAMTSVKIFVLVTMVMRIFIARPFKNWDLSFDHEKSDAESWCSLQTQKQNVVYKL